MEPERTDNPEVPEVPPVIFSCSGASDVGGLGDAAARLLSQSGVTRMYCLAGVGARVEQIMADPVMAERLVAVDGCDNDCSRKVLERAGFRPAMHIRITDLGMPKNRTGFTPGGVQKVADEVRRRLEGREPEKT
jgi:uncharacterized metal-binding protein